MKETSKYSLCKFRAFTLMSPSTLLLCALLSLLPPLQTALSLTIYKTFTLLATNRTQLHALEYNKRDRLHVNDVISFAEDDKLSSREFPPGNFGSGNDQPRVEDRVVAGKLNLRPVIGILSQEPSFSMAEELAHLGLNYTSYIAASYVKSVEGAGSRVVPILINQPVEYYERLVASLNGILFPGGAVSITNSSGFGSAGDTLYRLVLKAASNGTGSPVPLWATCLGFEMLVYLAAGHVYPLTNCSAQDRAYPLHLTPGWQFSALWRNASSDVINSVQTQNITFNFHKYCVTPQTFSSSNVSNDFKVLSTNTDDNGLEFVSTIEHKRLPIFGTQWHPEKNAYEWKSSSIPHTAAAVELEQHVMKVFVSEARRNHNSFATEEETEKYLIYNYAPLYTAKHIAPSFEQSYFF